MPLIIHIYEPFEQITICHAEILQNETRFKIR